MWSAYIGTLYLRAHLSLWSSGYDVIGEVHEVIDQELTIRSLELKFLVPNLCHSAPEEGL